MSPMLARTYCPSTSLPFPCYIQPKLNGVRALYQNGVFQSRDEKIWKPSILAHLSRELQTLSFPYILDGELYAHGWRLQRINSAVAVNRLHPNPDTTSICYCVFDLYDPKNPNLTFVERWALLNLLLANLKHTAVVGTSKIWFREQIDLAFRHWTADGFEGVMIRTDEPYEFGRHVGSNGNVCDYRSRSLWKYKAWQDGEFLCVGVTSGEGKADIGVGALVLQCLDSTNTFKVGTGLTDEDRIAFAANPPLSHLVKIRYLEMTEDGVPFNPSFLAVMS